nr:MAG TPA: hypothetical protein [Caudoviricetes sp.]
MLTPVCSERTSRLMPLEVRILFRLTATLWDRYDW